MKNWSKEARIAAASLAVAILTLVGTFIVPEIREELGLDKSPGTPAAPADTFQTAVEELPPATDIPEPSDTSVPPTLIPAETATATSQPATRSTPTSQDCWTIVWAFNPVSSESIVSSLTPPRSGYSAGYDASEFADEPGSLRLETGKDVSNWLQDPNAWSWMTNLQVVKAQEGRYRLVAWLKIENATQSHISVVGRDVSDRDVVKGNTNQIASVPLMVNDGTFAWYRHFSVEFDPKEWDPSITTLVIGLNAGWSKDGQPAITWFDGVELQHCQE